MGCRLEATIDNAQCSVHNSAPSVEIKGHACKRGVDYGKKECTNPTRILTTTLEVEGGTTEVASVKTEKDIPKDKLFDCVKILKKIKLNAPVHIGDIIVENILGTGVNIVATSNSEKLGV